jgi:RimJ/RimL family protein N-acetyltransferase
MNISYRRVEEKDWKKVSELEKSVDSDIYLAYTTEKDVKEYLNKSTVYFIELDDEPIGTISYEKKSKDHAYLDGLIVHPDYQGHGYATQAVDWLLDKVKNYKKIDLVTHPKNSASIIVYLKNGFVITGWKDDYFGDGEPRLILEYERNENR